MSNPAKNTTIRLNIKQFDYNNWNKTTKPLGKAAIVRWANAIKHSYNNQIWKLCIAIRISGGGG